MATPNRQDHWWEKPVKKIDKRDWNVIADSWLGFVPVDRAAGVPPSLAVEDLTTVTAFVRQLPSNNQVTKVDQIDSLYTSIFLEGVYLLHKASNSLAGSQIHVTTGLCSWSLNSAYQSAFYSMKAILHLLGVTILDVDKSCLIDVWTEPESLSSKQRGRGMKPNQQMLYLKFNRHRLDHHPMWGIFQRLLRVTSVDSALWRSDVVSQLTTALSADDFAGQRNALNYRNAHWPFPDDLLACVSRGEFAVCSPGHFDVTTLEPSRDDFTMVLSFVLFRMAVALLEDMAERSDIIQAECHALRTWLAEDHHSRFIRFEQEMCG